MNAATAIDSVESRWARVGTGSGFAHTIGAYLRLTRPTTRLWLDTLMPFAVLVAATGGRPDARTAILLIVAMNTIHVGATVINDIQDVETDRSSSEAVRRNRPIACGAISVRTARTLAIVSVVVGIACAFFTSVLFGAIVVGLTAMTVLNEVPPLHVQTRTVLAQAWTTIGLLAFMFAIIYVLVPHPVAGAALFGVFGAVYLGLCETLVKDIRDTDNDTKGGKVTTAVKFGAAAATAAAGLANLLSSAVWLGYAFTGELPAVWAGLCAACLLAWTVFVFAAANALRQRFIKPLCIWLHKGSVLIFAAVNLMTVIGLVS
jgi:4-hydroxybenzoate polyprenyltransferase